MKRASYKHAVEWIALNDEPNIPDWSSMECLISVALIADIFGVPASKVAKDVQKLRDKQKETE